MGDRLLTVLPPSLGYLESLKDLSVSNCPKLICLPDTFGLLTQLTKLKLEDCGIQYLTRDLLQMNNLKILEVRECPLGELPFQKAEGERETVVALNGLDDSNDDKCMFGLKSLVLWDLKIREVTFPGGVCPNLQYLCFHGCEELRQIGTLCGLEKLQQLKINWCRLVKELPSLETLTLELLTLSGCSKLKSIQGLGQLTQLRTLHVDKCHEIKELPGLEHLILLEVLRASECYKLKGIQGLRHFTKLRSLCVENCHKIKELPGVEHLMSLRTVDVRDCPKLQ